MNSLSFFEDPSNPQLERQAIARADLLSDAVEGVNLMRQLEERWCEQGVNAFLLGLAPSTLWNEWQLAGYAQAQAEMDTVLAEADAKPWLQDVRPMSEFAMAVVA